MKIEFIATREDNIWVFDHSHNDTFSEPLCNGTELVLDEYFKLEMKRDVIPGDKLKIIADTEKFKEFDTELILETTDEYGSIYLDSLLYEKVWLCPWLQSYFHKVPEKLYVKLNAVNLGKESFERTLRTGVNPFTKYIRK